MAEIGFHTVTSVDVNPLSVAKHEGTDKTQKRIVISRILREMIATANVWRGGRHNNTASDCSHAEHMGSVCDWLRSQSEATTSAQQPIRRSARGRRRACKPVRDAGGPSGSCRPSKTQQVFAQAVLHETVLQAELVCSEDTSGHVKTLWWMVRPAQVPRSNNNHRHIKCFC